MHRLHGWRAGLASLTLVVAVGGCGAENNKREPPSVLAQVGSVKLVRGDLHGRSATPEAIRALIEGEWLRQELSIEGIAASGSDLRDPARRSALMRQFLRKRARAHPTIGPRELNAYYLKHTELFKEPERREIRLIRLIRRKQADTAVADSDVFISLVASHSVRKEAPGAGHVGAFTVAQGELPHVLDKAVFNGGFGEIGGPIRAPNGWWVFEVHSSSTDAVRQPLREVKHQVYRRIRAERRHPTLSYVQAELAKEYRPRTRCVVRLVAAVCGNGRGQAYR